MTEVRKHITKYRVTVAGLASLGFFYTLAATLSTVFLGQLTQQMAAGIYSGLEDSDIRRSRGRGADSPRVPL